MMHATSATSPETKPVTGSSSPEVKEKESMDVPMRTAHTLEREDTPSTSSSQSNDTAPLQRTLSDASADLSSGSSLGQSSQGKNEEDMEKFLKKMDMEKKMQALQRRLELASVKASNGWTGMTINEIETQLTPKTGRRNSNLMLEPLSPTTSTRGGYEPPSPSRPWQLIDVLWQPLPPPSGGKYPNSPLSPSSPRKRSRGEYQGEQPPQRALFSNQQSMRPIAFGPPVKGHRRSSSTALQPASPLRPFKEGEKKRRSYSHSTQSTTRQDVDAANALTSMLGSGSPTQATFRRRPESPFTSLSIPEHDRRALSDTLVPQRRVRSNTPPKTSGQDETADKDAADLMLFLAHSPSPVTRLKPATNRLNEVRGTARVLFQDEETEKPKAVRTHSNLASAPPITNTLDGPALVD